MSEVPLHKQIVGAPAANALAVIGGAKTLERFRGSEYRGTSLIRNNLHS